MEKTLFIMKVLMKLFCGGKSKQLEREKEIILPNLHDNHPLPSSDNFENGS